MLSKKVIEKHIRRELNETEWKRLVNADYHDVFNWMTYHSNNKKAS